MNNRELLLDMMHDNELDRRDLAALVRVDRQMVDAWLAPAESTRKVEIPDMAIELLRIKLGGEVNDSSADSG